MYYLGVEEWLKDMYNQEDLVDHMRNDIGGPPGSLQESHGWKAKITDNPVMQEDVRHLGLVGTADSVPYFKDKLARGGVPFMLRNGNLPAELQLELKHCHLVGILPNEVHALDEDTGTLRRVVKKNSTLYPMLLVLADELNLLYVQGCTAVDSTRAIGDPERIFTLRVLLLYWYAVSCHVTRL